MPLPLELIWLLHKNAIIPLELFIQANLGNGVIYKRLIKDLLSLLVGDFNKDKEKLSKCMITGKKIWKDVFFSKWTFIQISYNLFALSTRFICFVFWQFKSLFLKTHNVTTMTTSL